MTWNKDEIRELRKALGLTQMEFADLLGCRQQTISEWEQGVYAPANAYGKLLSQLRTRAPLPRLTVRPTDRFDLVDTAGEDTEIRPFDPAID